MKTSLLIALSGLAFAGTASASVAGSSTVTATLTADNHYALFVGNGDGSALSLIGRNEAGELGSPGAYNWSLPETWTFDVNPGQFIYVMAWDDGGNQGWIGNFTWGGNQLISNTTDWVSTVAPGANPGMDSPLPTLATLTGYISTATWTTPGASAPNGTWPWFTVPGVGATNWIWHDTLGANSASDSHFALFRTTAPVVAAVPEASTYAMMGMGVFMVFGAIRRASRQGVSNRIG